MCKFCEGIAEWSRTHCYRCDVSLTATGAEYQLCPGCLSALGLGEQPTEPEVYWRARESAAQPTDESENERPTHDDE